LESNENVSQLEEDEIIMIDNNKAQIVHQNSEQDRSLNFQKQSLKKRKVRGEDSRVNEAFEYLKQKTEEMKKIQDEFSQFGDLIATKLRAMDKITQQYVMHDINNIMFNATLNTYYPNAQQHQNNHHISSFQQIPPQHSTYQSNKETPAVPPYLHTPSLSSHSMYKHDQPTTSTQHLTHPSY